MLEFYCKPHVETALNATATSPTLLAYQVGGQENKDSWNNGSLNLACRILLLVRTAVLLALSSACSSKNLTSRGTKCVSLSTQSANESQQTLWYRTRATSGLSGSTSSFIFLNSSLRTGLSLKKKRVSPVSFSASSGICFCPAFDTSTRRCGGQ